MANIMSNRTGKMLLLPFRVGTTSYIYDGDMLSNVHKLEGKVDDIELILHEAGGSSNIPCQKDLEELRRVGNRKDLSYTVHLPLDIDLGSGISAKRKDAVGRTVALVDQLSGIDPHAYILHMNLSKRSEGNINAGKEGSAGRWKRSPGCGLLCRKT
jgi:hypothetical protein